MTIARPPLARDDLLLLNQISSINKALKEDLGKAIAQSAEHTREVTKQSAAVILETIKQSGAETVREISAQNARLKAQLETLAVALSAIMTHLAELKAARGCASVPAADDEFDWHAAPGPDKLAKFMER